MVITGTGFYQSPFFISNTAAMFITKNLVHDVKDVPVSWIFEHFCKLKEKLNGHDVKIKSIFNPKERTPSMCIYLNKDNVYRYKDFSSGKYGSAIDLVKDITQLSYYKACQQVVEKYNDFVLHNNGGYDLQEFKQASKYKVSSTKSRQWNTSDQYFWTQFNIGTKLLTEHHVIPLESYYMIKDDKELCIKGNFSNATEEILFQKIKNGCEEIEKSIIELNEVDS